MKVYILMSDCGFDYEPDVSVYGVYHDESVALANKLEAETKYYNTHFWVEDWEVE